MNRPHQIFLVSWLIVLIAATTALAFKPRTTQVRRIAFKRGQTEAMLRGRLKPYTKHIYRFRGAAGQQLSLRLMAPPEDVVLFIQATKPFSGSDSFLLPGISKNGVTDWYGELPANQDYEIHVTNPRISAYPVRRLLSYEFRLTIE